MCAADGGMVYVGANNGNLFAIEASTGREQWRFATEGPIFATPALSTAKGQDVVYAASWDGHVYAVRTGTLTAGFEVDPVGRLHHSNRGDCSEGILQSSEGK